MKEETTAISKQIGKVVFKSISITQPLHSLEYIREKLMERDYQSLDKQDILDEMGRLQHKSSELNTELLKLYDLLQSKSYGY
jgi:nitrate/nitrite-specific signal transduction histidine kinase